MAFIAAVLSLVIAVLVDGAAAQASPRPAKASIADLRRETPEASPRRVEARAQVEGAFRTLADARAARAHGAARDGQLTAVRKAAEGIFDWNEMARDALGEHWAHMTAEQRGRFARLLAQLVERLYLPMLERPGSGDARIEPPIVYLGETDRGDEVVVSMVWKRPGRDLAVDCSMRRRGGAWRIRDVALDGISMVENYRAQVDRVIQRSSYDDLVARMEAKVSSGP